MDTPGWLDKLRLAPRVIEIFLKALKSRAGAVGHKKYVVALKENGNGSV